MNDRWQLLLWDVDVLFGGGPGAIASNDNFFSEVATINATFEITSNNGNNFTTSQNPYSLIGNAPVSVTTDQSERNTLSGDVGFPGSECYAQKTGEVDNFSAVERRGQLAQCPGLRPP